jgi:hypothetical protein
MTSTTEKDAAAMPAKDAEKAANPSPAATTIVDDTTAAPYRQEPEDRQRDYEGPYFCDCCLW